MNQSTPFSAIVAARTRTGNTVSFEITEDWQQGRTAYGGVVCAIAAQAMRDVAGENWAADVSMRALQCSFVSVVAAGVVQVEVEVLRQGRNVCQVLARVIEGGRLGSVMLGVYSADRPSELTQRRPQRRPARVEADELQSVPFQPGRMPPFLQHMEMRWSEGNPPYSGIPGDHSSIHMRLRDRDVDAIVPEVLTVLLADAPATPAVSELARPTAMSSVTWNLDLREHGRVDAGGWWRIDCQSLVVEGGYVNHASQLWAPSGALAALGTQVVTVFA